MNLSVFEVYEDFILNIDKRYQVLYGGAAAGKSYAAAQKVITTCLSNNNVHVLVVRKFYSTLEISCISLLLKILNEMECFNFKYTRSPHHFTFVNGSTISFMGLDKQEKLKSLSGPTLFWIEEADQISLEDFLQLDIRNRDKSSISNQIIITFNPVSRENWIYTHFFTKKSEDVYILKTTYKDNPVLQDQTRKQLESLQYTDINWYNIYALGDWGSQGSLIYNNYNITPFPISNYDKCWFGLDFGFNAPSALTCIYKDGTEYYIKELLYETQLTETDLINRLKLLIPSKSLIYCDTARPEIIQALQRAGFKAIGANKDVDKGISFIKNIIKNIHIDSNSKNLLFEMGNYQWKKKNEIYLDIPVKENDHLLDSMRYGIYTDYVLNGNKQVSKNVLIVKKR